MSSWEPTKGASDEWYTPYYIFDALGEIFDMDVAAPTQGSPHVPARLNIDKHQDGLAPTTSWNGFVWMNPPFGGRNGLTPWLDKFFNHQNGIALTPDRTSAPWWQNANRCADATLFVAGKIKFERPDGSLGKSPSSGTTLFASGERAVTALCRAEQRGLGVVMKRVF